MFTIQQIKAKPFITTTSKSGYIQIYHCTLILNEYLYLTKIWKENKGYISNNMNFKMRISTFNEKQLNNEIIGLDLSLDEVKSTLAELFI